MSLNLFSSKLKYLAMLTVLMLSAAFVNAQDSITAFGQTGAARLDVSTLYGFNLTSSANTAGATWTFSGTVGAPVAGDFTVTGAPGPVVNIIFSANLVDPTNANKNANNVYTVTATYGTVSTSISVTLLPQGTLLAENIQIKYYRLDPITHQFGTTSGLDIVKGEVSSNIANDGETIRVEFSVITKTPALPISLSNIKKIGFRGTDVNNANLVSTNEQLPPLFQITAYLSPTGNISNGQIPAVDLPNNKKGYNEIVLFPYSQIPYWYRMDTIDFENNIVEPRDNYSYISPVTFLNPCRELMDPRINYDYFRSKLWLADTLTELHVFNSGVPLPAANGNLLTDSTSLIDLDLTDTSYIFRPNPVPSANALAGAASGVNANQFTTSLSGTVGYIDLPIKALDHGAVGRVRLVTDVFASETSSTVILSEPLTLNVVAKVPQMTLRLLLDSETIGNDLFVTTVVGKDINLRIFVDRVINGLNPLIPAYEGPSGAQEYIVVDDNTDNTDVLWIFRNFDEYVFDSMEFDGTLYGAGAAQTAGPAGPLFYGAADRLTNTWKHHGLHLNVQDFEGTLSNTLFNDIPYLIANDNNAYVPANRNSGTVMNSNGRYTLTKQTKIGLVRETAPQRFMYSQARLYTKDSNLLRDSLPTGLVTFSANLFQNNRGILPQRAITMVPRQLGVRTINVKLMTADGSQIIDSRTVFLDIVPEIITETVLDPAELDDYEAKPVRAGDNISYSDKAFTSTYSDFGITTFDMRLEGIGAATDILYSETTGAAGAKSYGEVDLDDVASFRFFFKDNYSFYYLAPNNDAGGSVQGIGGRPDLDGDVVSKENFYESTGRPEPVHLQFNGIDDDNDGVVDDRIDMPTGRAESAAIRISQGQRSIYYAGGTLRRYYSFDAMKQQVVLFKAAVSNLNFVVITPALLTATQAAYPTITSAGITAAFNAASADPFLPNIQPGSPRKTALLNAIKDAISAYEYNTVNYGSMVNELTLPNPANPSRPTDDFAPIPTATGIAPIVLNTYLGEVVNRNIYNVGAGHYSKPIKLASAIRTCVPKEVWFRFTHQVPWLNRNGNGGLIPLSFVGVGIPLTTGFSFSPSLSVTDKKYVGPFADLNVYPSFTNAVMALAGKPATYQNFSTRFQFSGGVSASFINKMTNNYRPFLNMTEYPYPPPVPAPKEIEYSNFAGLNGWLHTYILGGVGYDAIYVQDGTAQEGKTWVVEQRVGAILDLPDANYSIANAATFRYVRQNEIIIPEEDNRWRPDDTGLQGFESWFRNFPIREVLSTESNYVAQFGIDQAFDPEHTPRGTEVVPTPYRIDYLSPSPAFHEVAGNNAALRLFLPSEMLDNNATAVAAPFLFFEDMDDSGTFNIAVDLARNAGSIHGFNALTRTFYSLITVSAEWDPKYDEQYDFFIVTRFDSGYPDIVTGPPPFNVANQPDSSAVRFGIKVELFKPNSLPKASPDYVNFMDRDGKDERSMQDNYFVVNVRVDANDVDMVINTYQDADAPLDANGFVVLQGAHSVKAMTGRDQIGGIAGSNTTKDVRSPADLIGAFSDITQKFGSSTFPFVPFSRTALSTLILTGDVVNPGFFPLSAQGTSTLSGGIMWNHIHLPVLPSAERTANFDKIIERKNSWKNDVYAQVRPFERDKNGNGICDPSEDFNSDGAFTQDVVLLSFKPEVYPAGHPRAGQSFYNATSDFLNMSDIRWSIVKNESGSYLSSDTGYLVPGDATGTNYVTYYPGSLNGLDYIKGENIKTGRSLIAVVLVRNNPACDGIDNDNDAPLGTFVTTIGSLMSLPATDPRFAIRCINPTAAFNASAASALENFPNIDFADDDYLDGAASLDAGYAATPFTNIGTGVANKGNSYIDVSGTYVGLSDISVVMTSTYAGTGTIGTNPISFSAAFTDSITTLTTTVNFTLVATGNTLIVYNDTTTGSTVTVTFLPVGGLIALGDKFTFTMLGEKDWDADSYTRTQELTTVPGAMQPETIAGYNSGLEIDLSWNNPRPFYAIKVRADKPATDAYNGEYGKDYVFTTKLMTKEVVGSGVWTQTVEMALDDMRYLGAGGLLAGAPTSINAPFDATPTYLYFRVGSLVNNTGSSSFTAGNLLVVSENQYYTPAYVALFEDRVALGGVDLLRITQNPNGIMRGEWRDDTGDISNYPLAEYCLFPHMTKDAVGRSIYDFDIATLPGDNTRYAAAVFESNHTIADYTTAGYGLVRIDPNSMPTPILQLNAADSSDPVTLTFTDGERLQKIRVNFLNVRGFKPTAITDDPNTRTQDTMLAPLSNDMLGGISLWKDNKDPGALALLSGKDLISGTLGRSAITGSIGHFDALIDVVVDLDGWDSPRAYSNYSKQYSNPVIPITGFIPLTSFKIEDKIYFVDRDGSKSFSLGDDIYFDQGQPGLDNGDKIIYTQRGLGVGTSYSLGDPAHSERVRYYDENKNGKYDNGEDIVYEANNLNGRWELPIDKYVPLDKDALRWRWDKENNLWYIVLDLENDEEIPPEDVFVNLDEFYNGGLVTAPNLAALNFPGAVPPNFYNGADYHVCLRTSTNMDYLSAFMVEIPDFWKHTQALSNFDDIAGVWLATQPSTVTYPSMPGSSVISPVIVANMPVLISDETIDRQSRNRIGRNSKPFPILGINLMDNSFNALKMGNDLLKTIFESNMDSVAGSNFGVRLANINGNRKTVLEDLVVELFNNLEGTVGSVVDANGTIIPGDFNPTSDLLALDRTCKGDDIFRSIDGTGIFKTGDTKILRLGSFLENGRLHQDDLTVGKQGKQDTSIVFVDINSNGVYDDNLDILVYDIDGLTGDGLPTGTRTFKFGDAILKRGFSNWDITVGAANDVSRLTPNELSLIIGKQLVYDSSLWFEDDDESGGFSNETSSSGVALYRDRSDGSPYDNGKFDTSISASNEIIVLDEVIYLEEIEYTGQQGQPQHQVRMRPAVFDISSTFLGKVLTNGLADPTATSVDHFVTGIAKNNKATYGGTGEDYRDESNDDLFNPFIDLDLNGIDDSNKLYPYNKDTSLPDHHPLRCNLFQDKISPSYGDENGMGPYGEWGYLRAPLDDGQSSLVFDQSRAISRNTGNKHYGPDFFVVVRTSNVATNGDDFRAGISSWGRDPAQVMNSAPQKELGSRGIGFDDRVEDFEAIGIAGGTNSPVPFLYPGPPAGYTGTQFGDVSNSRTYTKFLSAVILVDGLPPEDVKTLTASIFEGGTSGPNLVELTDQIQLDWEWEKDPDLDRTGVLLIRRKGLAPDLKLLEDGEYYIGPEITSEKGEERRKYLPGYLGFATKTKLITEVSAGSLLATAISSTDVSIAHADFVALPVPPTGGKCYLLISADVNNGKSEIVSYTTVGSTIIVTRGELGTTAVAHAVNSSVTYMPPRPVKNMDLMSDNSPVTGSPVIVKVDKVAGGLAGFPNAGVIRIGAEVMQYDSITIGTTFDSFNILNRGINSTGIAPHSAGNKIHWNNHPTYTADTIFVQSTAGFPTSGRLKIGAEEIWYNSKTGNSFKGIVRGIYTDDAYKTNTLVVAHLNDSEVLDSLYKVIMNDADLDGPKDYNNDKNEDGIVKTWTDDLYYGEEASSYFYYLFTYDDVLNYSDGKFASVNSMTIKRYTPPTGTGVDAITGVTYSNINLGNKINVKGGDTLFFTVEGGSPKFGWTATAAGLALETAPTGFDTKGENDRYVSYTVPDIPDVDQTDIVITVTDSSSNAQVLSVVLFVEEVTPYLDPDLFNVTSDIGTPPVKTNKDTTVQIQQGDVITFTAGVPAAGNIATVVWSSPGPNTFLGQVALNPAQPNVLRYTAVNLANPTLTTGSDILSVTDGTTTIKITIIIAPNKPPAPPCFTTEPLRVLPGASGSVIISPGSSVTFTAQGGTCNFLWALIANNSEGASVTRTDAIHAIYTAGTINRTVDVIELSDGINTKRIEVHVVSSSSNGGGGGCFIRPKASQRD